MKIKVTRARIAKGTADMASALKNGPVIFFLYKFHGVAVEGYKSGKKTVDTKYLPQSRSNVVSAPSLLSHNVE